MRVSLERHARTRATKSQLNDRTETGGSLLSSSGALSSAYESAVGLSCGAVLGGIYGGASFGWEAALGGAAFGSFVAMIAVATFWSLRSFLERRLNQESAYAIALENPSFSGVNKSAVVAAKPNSEVNLLCSLAAWTLAGAVVGASAGAGLAALMGAPDWMQGAIRMAPACATLAFLARLAVGPVRRSPD